MPGDPNETASPFSSQASRLAVTFRALRHRNFQLFFAGQLISLIGTWMDSVAEAWLMYRLTGSSLMLGLVSFAGQFPVFLLGPLGGAIADRFDRRRVIVATQSTSMVLAFLTAALTISGRIQVYQLFILAALFGVVNAVDIPTRQAFVVDMVGKEDLMNAIALNSSMVNGARIVGPAVAGILVASIGEGWCFFSNGVSYIAVITGLLLMRVAAGTLRRGASPGGQIVEGFRFVARTAPIRALLLLLGLMSLMGMPYAVLMPIFAAQVLHSGPRGLGLLMGATGTGALIGALTLATRRGLKGLGSWVAVASSGFGCFLIAFSFSRHFWLSVAFLVPTGFCFMVQMASSNTLIQAMVPDQLRGRVMSVYSMMFMGMAPFGALVAGAVAHHLGAPITVALGGTVCVLGGITFGMRLPGLRPAARQLIVAQQMVGGDPAQEVTGTTPHGEIASQMPNPAAE